MSSLRLALVYRALNVSGSLPRFHVELARYLVRRGHDVHVFSMPGRSDPALVPGATFHAVPVRPRRGSPFSARELGGFARRSGRMLAEEHFDIVHVRAPSGWSGDVLHVPGVMRGEAEVAGASGRRLALGLARRPGSLMRYGVEQRALRLGGFRSFHAEAPIVAEHLTRFYGIERERIIVLPPGVNLDEFRPAPNPEVAKAAVGIETSRPAVLFCGHDFQRKGLDLTIEAIGGLGTELTLMVVGGDANESRFRALAAAAGIGGNTIFLGSRADAASFFQAADVFVLPTRADIWGATVVEAMACGVPPIVSGGAGVASVVEDGRSGIVLPPDSGSLALREAIERLIGDPVLRVEMGRAAAERAEGLSWEVHGETVENDLLRLAEASRSPSAPR